MTEIPDSVQVNVARAGWRADLLNYHADELKRLAGEDSSPAAAALVKQAEKKASEAELHQTAAGVEQELADAKAASQADPKDLKLRKRYQQAAQEMADMRVLWRGIDEALGSRRGVLSVDDFPEPSDDEILGKVS